MAQKLQTINSIFARCGAQQEAKRAALMSTAGDEGRKR